MNILCWDRVGGSGFFQMMGETEFSSSRLGELPEFSRIRDELEHDQEKGNSLRRCGEAFSR